MRRIAAPSQQGRVVQSGVGRKVAVLLAAYNGGQYLQDQLASLASQSYPAIDVWLSDDGSTDNTIAIADKAARRWSKGNFAIIRRNSELSLPCGRGGDVDLLLARCKANFLSLILNDAIDAEYFAFCDQDDIWEPTKLSRAVAWLNDQPEDLPAMHCSRTRIIDDAGRERGLSLRFSRPPGFRNAIVQNIAAGNTIVMNRAAMTALRQHSVDGQFVSHDWWAYILVTALGGRVRYDEEPLTQYRQHSGNLIGENASWRARMMRLKLVLRSRFRSWNETNLKALQRVRHLLPAENCQVLDEFSALRKSTFFLRPYRIMRAGIFRQTFPGQLSFLAASLMGKI